MDIIRRKDLFGMPLLMVSDSFKFVITQKCLKISKYRHFPSILAYLTEGNRNVNLIYINWENASNTLNYIAATRYVPRIGVHVADFIDFMVIKKFALNVENESYFN